MTFGHSGNIGGAGPPPCGAQIQEGHAQPCFGLTGSAKTRVQDAGSATLIPVKAMVTCGVRSAISVSRAMDACPQCFVPGDGRLPVCLPVVTCVLESLF